MLHTKQISATLAFLEKQYQEHLGSSDAHRPILFSKMAILEYCGWLEEAFDEISRNCVRASLRTIKSRGVLEVKIKETHGFTYEKIRPLLAIGKGVVKLNKIEKKMDKDGSLQRLKSDLGTLNKMRRTAAHTFTSGRTPIFDSPSITIQNFNKTKPTMLRLWSLVCEKE